MTPWGHRTAGPVQVSPFRKGWRKWCCPCPTNCTAARHCPKFRPFDAAGVPGGICPNRSQSHLHVALKLRSSMEIAFRCEISALVTSDIPTKFVILLECRNQTSQRNVQPVAVLSRLMWRLPICRFARIVANWLICIDG